MNKEILEAIKELNNHKVIAFPTETVMGLGILYNDYEAYQLLNNIKRRPEDKPYTMMLGNKDDIEKYAYIDSKIKRVIDKYLPGSLTLLLKAKDNVPNYVTHNTGVVGIRIPSNKEALSLLNEVKIPLLVPSANRSGEKPCLNSDEVKVAFGEEIKAVIEGESTSNVPSTIIDFTKEKPVCIREGILKFDEVLSAFLIKSTLCYIYKDGKYLLLYRNKKEHDNNANKYIGVGGKVEPHETIEECLIREVKEETNLTLKTYVYRGLIHFSDDESEDMYLFTSDGFVGELKESNEGTLVWVDSNELLSLPTWEGDKYFLEAILNNEKDFEMVLKYENGKLNRYERIK